MISYKEKRKQFSEEAQKRIQKRAQQIKDIININPPQTPRHQLIDT